MHLLGRLSLGLTLCAATIGACLAPAAASTNPIKISQCFITAPRPMSHTAGGTQIDFTNRGTKTATQIVFAVGYRNAAQHFLRRVTDYGTFSPGVLIQNHFSLFSDVTYAGKSVTSCQAVQVRWSDHTTWSP